MNGREYDSVDEEIRVDIAKMSRDQLETMMVEVFDAYTRLCMTYKTLKDVIEAQITFFENMSHPDAEGAAQTVRDILDTCAERLGPMTQEIFSNMNKEEE